VSRVALLDVNVLVALFNPQHTHHEVAHDWFADHQPSGWATCAITQNGFVRVLASPASDVGVIRPVDLVDRLRQFCSNKHHVFWTESVSLTDAKIFNPALIRGHRQVSDIYLLGLAKKMGGYLATLDGGIPLGAVVGATRDTIAVISPDASDQ
jgi:toxin-antitoxin system PIN domain toxin